MNYHININDIIVAISTPYGYGGIGSIRMSGKNLNNILFLSTNKKKFMSRYAHYVFFYDKNKNIIDRGICIFFNKPNSYTGEDVVEFYLHGNPLLLDMMIDQLLLYGARLAYPGEFTFRSFWNNKIDLLQAQSIMFLINSKTKFSIKKSIDGLTGIFSKEIYDILDDIIKLRSLVEIDIDFVFIEDDYFYHNLRIDIKRILKKLKKIINNFIEQDNTLNGIDIIIIGNPNVGKSSLINFIFQKNIAIVSNIAGTTRDLIKKKCIIDGVIFNFVDTAGLLDIYNNILEEKSINLTIDIIKKSSILIYVMDVYLENFSDFNNLYVYLKKKYKIKSFVIFVVNKIDVFNITSRFIRFTKFSVVYMSVKNNDGLNFLIDELKFIISFNNRSNIFILKKNYSNILYNVHDILNNAYFISKCDFVLDILAEHLFLAHDNLSKLLGKNTSDDLLKKIFSNFCVGK